MITNVKDLLAGLVFLALAAAFGFAALGYELGTAFRMGPGYFPLVLAGILALLGLVIAANGMRTEGGPLGGIPFRGLALVLLAPVVFGLTARGLGLVPSIALVVLIGAFASVFARPLSALLLALALTAFCTAVFSFGLGIPIQRFGPWVPQDIAAPLDAVLVQAAGAVGAFAAAIGRFTNQVAALLGLVTAPAEGVQR